MFWRQTSRLLLVLTPTCVGLVLVGRSPEGVGSDSKHCWVQQQSTVSHVPPTPSSLAEYKDAAEGCLTSCATLDDKCFDGCIKDCTSSLGSPPCASFVFEQPCNEACGSLSTAYSCVLAVSPNATHECHIKFSAAAVPESGCPYED
mmetsp:Transcript_13634/g.25041  ORF Transcript_13634/g.25041 Transcript_13634/m.25041 type:complete len:146 (+) Transcript_13634:83-520(+)